MFDTRHSWAGQGVLCRLRTWLAQFWGQSLTKSDFAVAGRCEAESRGRWGEIHSVSIEHLQNVV